MGFQNPRPTRRHAGLHDLQLIRAGHATFKQDARRDKSPARVFPAAPADQAVNQTIHFMKDLALFGGLLHVVARGGSR